MICLKCNQELEKGTLFYFCGCDVRTVDELNSSKDVER
jgi:hypothetical protein